MTAQWHAYLYSLEDLRAWRAGVWQGRVSDAETGAEIPPTTVAAATPVVWWNVYSDDECPSDEQGQAALADLGFISMTAWVPLERIPKT